MIAAVIALLLAVFFAGVGLIAVLRPERFAHFNDTWGPEWFRNFGPRVDPARPGRTKPAEARVLGFVLLMIGLLLAVAAVAIALPGPP